MIGAVRARSAADVLAAVLVAVLLALSGAGPALADVPRPTADPSAPTPTAPYPGPPPQGSAPNGGTVGGVGLDTRSVVTAAGTPPLPDIGAQGWLVADATTGEVLAARDPHGRYYPASTLKTLTLLTLGPRLDWNLVVTGTPEDEQIEGSRVGLISGGQYPVPLLLVAMVLQSGNDAANALARTFGGVEPTVAAMNAEAAEIGAFDTVAGTPSGLDVAGQSSSPYDLALIFTHLVANPYLAPILTASTAQMPDVPGRAFGFQIQNQDPLLGSYPGNLGGKTGFTDAARHTFVTAAERGGRRLVVSLVDTENRPVRFDDQARLLLDWGFATAPGTSGVGRLVDSGAEALATAAGSPAETPAPSTPPTPTAAAAPVAAGPADSAGTSTRRPLLFGLTGGVVLVVALVAGGAIAIRRRRRAPTP